MRKATVLALLLVLAAGATLAQAVRVLEAGARKLIATRVEPVHPPMAKQMRLVGRVQLDVSVEKKGQVSKAQTPTGNLMLEAAAKAALKQWKFTPFQANGTPSASVATITFDFKLCRTGDRLCGGRGPGNRSDDSDSTVPPASCRNASFSRRPATIAEAQPTAV